MSTKRKPEDRGKVRQTVRPLVKSRRSRWQEMPFISEYALRRQYRRYHQRWVVAERERKRGVKAAAVTKRERRDR